MTEHLDVPLRWKVAILISLFLNGALCMRLDGVYDCIRLQRETSDIHREMIIKIAGIEKEDGVFTLEDSDGETTEADRS